MKTGRVYEIGQVYERGMPLGDTRDFALRLVPAIEPVGPNRVLYNDEFLAAEVGQVGTQFDGLGHIGGEVRYADGNAAPRVLQRLYDGRDERGHGPARSSASST